MSCRAKLLIRAGGGLLLLTCITKAVAGCTGVKPNCTERASGAAGRPLSLMAAPRVFLRATWLELGRCNAADPD